MRAFRSVAAVLLLLLGALLVAGCGPSGSGSGDGAPPKATPQAPSHAPPNTSTATGPSTAPAPGASPSAEPLPDPSATLVRVTRSGGFAGQTHTLVVKDDGSWTRLDAKAGPQGTGKLSEAELAALRTALREADFARLPRISTGGPKIYDGFFYAFAHGGFEVAGDEGSLPRTLTKVLDALPPFTAPQGASS
ncbi:hypothetical protein ACF059_01860 [Streptomyces sp. NPDC016562]|uniref:hypothetical protein n=1 Tax=Streptomyces sp. NPDC016562 TaxID=3364966 RepID=UPI003702C903